MLKAIFVDFFATYNKQAGYISYEVIICVFEVNNEITALKMYELYLLSYSMYGNEYWRPLMNIYSNCFRIYSIL